MNRIKGKSLTPRHVTQTIKHGGKSIMDVNFLWSCCENVIFQHAQSLKHKAKGVQNVLKNLKINY